MKKREDQLFLTWLSFQPSWLDGAFNEVDDKGRKRNIPCHVRRAGEERTGSAAGTGHKPFESAVPMTFLQHKLQSEKGELACIMAYTNYQRFLAPYEGETMVDKAKAAFDAAAAHYAAKWRREHAKVS